MERGTRQDGERVVWVTAGPVTLVMQNVGKEAHHAQFVKLNTGVTLDQFTAALQQGQGPVVAADGRPRFQRHAGPERGDGRLEPADPIVAKPLVEVRPEVLRAERHGTSERRDGRLGTTVAKQETAEVVGAYHHSHTSDSAGKTEGRAAGPVMAAGSRSRLATRVCGGVRVCRY